MQTHFQRTIDLIRIFDSIAWLVKPHTKVFSCFRITYLRKTHDSSGGDRCLPFLKFKHVFLIYLSAIFSLKKSTSGDFCFVLHPAFLSVACDNCSFYKFGVQKLNWNWFKCNFLWRKKENFSGFGNKLQKHWPDWQHRFSTSALMSMKSSVSKRIFIIKTINHSFNALQSMSGCKRCALHTDETCTKSLLLR